MTAHAAAVSPGGSVVRATVVRVDVPRSGLAVGDWFEFRGSRLVLREGMGLPPSLLASVAPLIALRQGDLSADHWLVRKPYLCGPDAEENLVVRLDVIRDRSEPA